MAQRKKRRIVICFDPAFDWRQFAVAVRCENDLLWAVDEAVEMPDCGFLQAALVDAGKVLRVAYRPVPDIALIRTRPPERFVVIGGSRQAGCRVARWRGPRRESFALLVLGVDRIAL